ncbi:uncharacterized protein FIBRA_00065 [Fibroporia radiculosa]|uniref:Uncharacterized protein n=1 Tax=Fibroporia radiculosa TaxID=599839 RepID=J7SBS1_9APHY|nr:uncharacterized protein FIBRA_00065 [Fibroporia radiculosa]CCL98071.1 predicted protein [Fibroporia radiculosa]
MSVRANFVQNHYAFSPNPWFIATFFFGQVMFQIAWIHKLFAFDPIGYHKLGSTPRADSAPDAGVNANTCTSSDDEEGVRVALAYAPVYALGSFCIAGWLLFWLRNDFVASQILVTVNTFAQLFAVARLPLLTPKSSTIMRLTHVVAITFAGIGVLDLIDNGGVVLRYRAPPSILVQGITYTLFPVATAASTPFFGAILLYDLFAIFVGQYDVSDAEQWSARVGWTALATGGIVGVKALLSWRKKTGVRT